MLFNQVINQQAAKDSLRTAVAHNRVSHAQLFLGPEGCGNLALALAFAQYIVCENRTEEDACGACPACVKAAKLIHPDIHFSFPVITPKSGEKPQSSAFLTEWREAVLENPYMNIAVWQKKIESENKQLNISIFECHDIISSLKLKSFESEYKILILWMPEYLGKEGNILLKLLEEPPEKTLMILVANTQDQVLTTILSRTQLLKLNRIGDEELRTTLISRHQLSEEQATKIVNQAEGNYNECLNLIENAQDENETFWKDWITLCLKKDIVSLNNWVDDITAAGRENQKLFLNYCLHFLHETISMQYLKGNPLHLQGNEINLAKKLNEQLSTERMRAMYEAINRSHYYIERNASSKVVFMNLTLQLLKILNLQDSDWERLDNSIVFADQSAYL